MRAAAYVAAGAVLGVAGAAAWLTWYLRDAFR